MTENRENWFYDNATVVDRRAWCGETYLRHISTEDSEENVVWNSEISDSWVIQQQATSFQLFKRGKYCHFVLQ